MQKHLNEKNGASRISTQCEIYSNFPERQNSLGSSNYSRVPTA